MRSIGIDMSKDSFHASFSDSEVVVFANEAEGINDFLSALKERKYLQKRTRIGTEATGVYHLLLSAMLKTEGWTIVIINPLISSRAIKNDSLRRVKNDKKDARVIRELTALGKGYDYVDTDDTRKLQAFCAERNSLVQMRAQCKQRHHAHSVRARAILSGIVEEPYTALIKRLGEDIKLVEERMAQTNPDTQKLLRSIPGIGVTAAAMLVAYVGDIHRFDCDDKLAAYIGIDPRVYESGTSVHGKGYISKRGNKPLRHILFIAAQIAKRYDPELNAFYLKKRREGKHHFVVLCAVERRLVNRIFAVWVRGTPYSKTPKAA